MWKVLPKFALIKFISYGFSVLLISIILMLSDNFGGDFFLVDLKNTLSFVVPTTFLFLIVIYVFAKYLWKLIWRIPILGKVLNTEICPDLNGLWIGKVQSSFSTEAKAVEMLIEADFIGFKITFRSIDNYLRSTVVQSDLYRDSRNGTFYVSYIFEAFVDRPEETDDSKFDGAAKLIVRFHSDQKIELTGTYWTNRAWQRGKHTAGTISLIRQGVRSDDRK
jgi:hypothetical protein